MQTWKRKSQVFTKTAKGIQKHAEKRVQHVDLISPHEPSCRTFICRNAKANDNEKESKDASNMTKAVMSEEGAIAILTKLKLSLLEDDVEAFNDRRFFLKNWNI